MKKIFFLFILFYSISTQAQTMETTIYDVVNREDKDTFSDMVVLGYEIDDTDAEGYTPLMIASSLGKPRFAEFLLKNGALINKRSNNGMTALHRAAQSGQNEMVDLLINSGAKINWPDYKGYTPLMYAVLGNNPFTVEHLYALGADINYRNTSNQTALDIAKKKKFKEIVSFLRAHGAE